MVSWNIEFNGKALDGVNVEIPFPQMDLSIKNPKIDINLKKD